MRKLVIGALAAGCFLAGGCVQRVLESAPAPRVPAEVPEVYRAAYHEIDAELTRQLPLVPLPWRQKASGTVFGAELPAADSRRGEGLLEEGALPAVRLALDRLKALGAGCVSLRLHYPLLTPRHPQAAAHREFHRAVAAEIRQRGLRIAVTMGSAPREPELSRIPVDYRGLKRGAFGAGLREMAELIIADIRPDYLTLLCEPDAQTRSTGLPFSAAEFAAVVAQVAGGLAVPGVKLGAGAGSWAAADYFKALAAVPELHYLDVHIRPVQYGLASDRVLKAAELARAKGKGIALGEAWLLKAAGRELDRLSPAEALGRDVFSFWQPLDGKFIQLAVDLARRVEAEFCSFSGMTRLFGYIDHSAETARLDYSRLTALADAAALENLRKGALSPTGETLRHLMRP